MNYKIEVIRAKDGGYRTWTNPADGTAKGLKKIINSVNLFYEAKQFNAFKIIDESGKVVFQKGEI